jgi:uncharacterized membrane protein YfcA
LLGAGGGIIVTFFLTKKLNKDGNTVFANAVATMLPISVLSFTLYLMNGYFSFDKGFLTLLAPAILGGLLGAFLLTKLKFRLLKIAFSLLVIVSGFMMITR